MEHDYKIELSKRRLEIAHERLTTAKAILELGDLKRQQTGFITQSFLR